MGGKGARTGKYDAAKMIPTPTPTGTWNPMVLARLVDSVTEDMSPSPRRMQHHPIQSWGR